MNGDVVFVELFVLFVSGDNVFFIFLLMIFCISCESEVMVRLVVVGFVVLVFMSSEGFLLCMSLCVKFGGIDMINCSCFLVNVLCFVVLFGSVVVKLK